MNQDDDYRAGTLRFFNQSTGEWMYAQPGSAMYSTLTMAATEFWNGRAWEQIFGDDDDGRTYQTD